MIREKGYLQNDAAHSNGFENHPEGGQQLRKERSPPHDVEHSMSIMYEGDRRFAKKQHETDKNNDVADPESEQNFYIPNPMEGQRGGEQKQEGRKKPPSETVCNSLLALVRRELVPARLDAYHHDKEYHQDDASPRDGGGKDRAEGKRSPQKPREEDVAPPLGVAVVHKGHQGEEKQKGSYDSVDALHIESFKDR